MKSCILNQYEKVCREALNHTATGSNATGEALFAENILQGVKTDGQDCRMVS